MNATDVLDRFASLPFRIEAEFGNVELSVRELMNLKVGVILETNHTAATPLTLRAGGAAFANADIVLTGAGVTARIKDVLTAAPRLETTAT